MKASFSVLLFAALIAIVFAAENDIKPTVALPSVSNVVCAMTICPTATLSKRQLACPSICKDDCKIIDDQCCPGVQKAICNSTPGTDSSSTVAPSPIPTPATPLPSPSGTVPSGSGPNAASSSTTTPTSTNNSASNNPPNQAGSNKAVVSTVLFMALISVTLLI